MTYSLGFRYRWRSQVQRPSEYWPRLSCMLLLRFVRFSETHTILFFVPQKDAYYNCGFCRYIPCGLPHEAASVRKTSCRCAWRRSAIGKLIFFGALVDVRWVYIIYSCCCYISIVAHCLVVLVSKIHCKFNTIIVSDPVYEGIALFHSLRKTGNDLSSCDSLRVYALQSTPCLRT